LALQVGGEATDIGPMPASLERKYDSQFKMAFDAIRQLMAPPETKKKKIGFRREIDD